MFSDNKQGSKNALRRFYGKGFSGRHNIGQKLVDGTIYFRNISSQGEYWFKLPIDLLNVGFLLTVSNSVILYFPELSEMWVSFLPIVILVWLCSVFVLGKVIDKKYNPVRVQNTFSNERNIEITGISKGILKIEKLLKKE